MNHTTPRWYARAVLPSTSKARRFEASGETPLEAASKCLASMKEGRSRASAIYVSKAWLRQTETPGVVMKYHRLYQDPAFRVLANDAEVAALASYVDNSPPCDE